MSEAAVGHKPGSAAAHAGWGIAEELIRAGRTFSYRARGQSMRPTIPDGAQVTIARASRVRVGDVVLIRRGHGATLHRVVALSGGMVLTKGDLNRRCDLPVRPERVLGRAVTVRRSDRTVSLTGAGARLRALLLAALSRALSTGQPPGSPTTQGYGARG